LPHTCTFVALFWHCLCGIRLHSCCL
jgi:hypothetical protein